MIKKESILFYCLLLIYVNNLFCITPLNSGKYSSTFGNYQKVIIGGNDISFHTGIDIVPDSLAASVVSPVDGKIFYVSPAAENTSSPPSVFDIGIYEYPYSESQPWNHIIAHVQTDTSSSLSLTLEQLHTQYITNGILNVPVSAGDVIARVGTVHYHQHIHYTTKHPDYTNPSEDVFVNPLSSPSFNGNTDPGNNAPDFGKLFISSGPLNDFLHGTDESNVDYVYNNVNIVREIWDNMNYSGQLKDGITGELYSLTIKDDNAYLSNGNGYDDNGDVDRFNGTISAPYKIEFKIEDSSSILVWPTQTVIFDSTISASKFDVLLSNDVICPQGYTANTGEKRYAYNLTAIDNLTKVETVMNNSNEDVGRYWATKLKIPDLSIWTNSESDFLDVLHNWYEQSEADINQLAVYEDGEYTVTTKAYDFANNS